MVKAVYLLIRDNYFFRRFPILRQLAKFALVGVSSFLIDFTIYILLTRNVDFFRYNYLIANVISFMIAVGWSFMINKYWTFRVMGNAHVGGQYVRFVLVYTVGLFLTSLLLYLFVSVAGVYDVLAKVIVAVLVMFWNFSGAKLWSFRKSS